MPLPAILSISIFGGMFLLISLYFYFKIKKQGKESGYEKMMQIELIKQDSKQSNNEQNINLTLGQQQTKEISSLPYQSLQGGQTLKPNQAQNQTIQKSNQKNDVNEKYLTPLTQQHSDTKSQGCTKVDDIQLIFNQNNQQQTAKPQIEQSNKNQDPNQNKLQLELNQTQLNLTQKQNQELEAANNISTMIGGYNDKQTQPDIQSSDHNQNNQQSNNKQNQEDSKNNLMSQSKNKINSQHSTSNIPHSEAKEEKQPNKPNNAEPTAVTQTPEMAAPTKIEKKSSEENVTPGEIQISQGVVDEHEKSVNNKNEQDSMKGSQIYNHDQQNLENLTLSYEKFQYCFLAISCAALVEAITGRVYIELNVAKIEFPQIIVLALISTGPTFIIFNVIEICIQKSRSQKPRIISRILFIAYGLVMGFPIYLGLDDFLELEFISVLFTIIFFAIFQAIFVHFKLINYTMFQ